MEELVVLVDDNNHPIGFAPKEEIHNNNTPLHRGFSVFLFNPKGQLLLQQRAKHKKTWGGVWSNSCCGHPLPEEENLEAVRRRLNYELGLNEVKLQEVLPHYRYKFENNGVWENEICPVFVGFTNEEPTPNPEEVENIKWVNWQDFLAEVKNSPENYSPWAVEEAKLLTQNKKFPEFLKHLELLVYNWGSK